MIRHGFEHGFVAREHGFVPADPDGHAFVMRAADTAADRRIQHVRPTLGERRMQSFHQCMGAGGHLHESASRSNARADTVVTKGHAFNRLETGKATEYKVALLGQRARTICPGGASLKLRPNRRAIDVMDKHAITGFAKVGGHRPAHLS